MTAERRTPDSSYDFGVWKGSVTTTLGSIEEKLNGFNEALHKHEESDTRIFASINESLSDLKVSQARWGAGLLVTLTLAGWILPPIVKRMFGAE